MSKLTPPQHALLRQIRAAGSRGLPVALCHDSTLSGLVRRGVAIITFGRAYLSDPNRDPDLPDAA